MVAFNWWRGVWRDASGWPLPPPLLGHPQKPQKVRNDNFVGGTPSGTFAYLTSQRTGDITIAIAPGRRCCQCSWHACYEYCPSPYARCLGLEVRHSALSPPGPTVDWCFQFTCPVDYLCTTSHNLCGWGGCWAHDRVWRPYCTGLWPRHSISCVEWWWSLPFYSTGYE